MPVHNFLYNKIPMRNLCISCLSNLRKFYYLTTSMIQFHFLSIFLTSFIFLYFKFLFTHYYLKFLAIDHTHRKPHSSTMQFSLILSISTFLISVSKTIVIFYINIFFSINFLIFCNSSHLCW